MQKLKYAIVGGYALALHGIVRATIDIDLILSLKLQDFELAEKALNKLGLQSRLPIHAKDVITMRKEYIQKRNLLAWSFVDYQDPTRLVDILILKDLKDIRTQKKMVGKNKIVVASLEELLKMKQAAKRPQDLIDITKIQEKLREKNS